MWPRASRWLILAPLALLTACSTSPTAPKAPGTPRAYDVSEVDSPPRGKDRILPLYPHQGHVILDLIVDPHGHVTDIHAESEADPAFVRAAIVAVSRWTYQPAFKDGHPVAVHLRIPIANGPSERAAAIAAMGNHDLPIATPTQPALPEGPTGKIVASLEHADANTALFLQTYRAAVHAKAYPKEAGSQHIAVALLMDYRDYSVELWSEADFTHDFASATNFKWDAFIAKARFKMGRSNAPVLKRWSYADIPRFCRNPQALIDLAHDQSK